MYDFIICQKKLPVPENFLNLDFSKEPFRTSSLSKNFNNYLISKDGFFYRQKNDSLEKINYSGFIYFSTHFFNEPHTKQYYISFFCSFKQGVLEELSLDGTKEYSIKDYDLKIKSLANKNFTDKKFKNFWVYVLDWWKSCFYKGEE